MHISAAVHFDMRLSRYIPFIYIIIVILYVNGNVLVLSLITVFTCIDRLYEYTDLYIYNI